MKSKVIHFLFWTLFSVSHLFAQTNPMDQLSKDDLLDSQNDDEVEVLSASRSNQKLKDLPITIEVITKEEIQRNGYITLADALKHIHGIKVSQPGSSAEGETFLMRGLIGNSYTKILLNSIPLQPSVSGALAIAEQLPIAQAERIEVIFGPASSVYGADAMAGVINIITLNDNEYNYTKGALVTNDVGYRHFNFMTGGKFGKDRNVIRYNIFANYADRDDLNTPSDSTLYSTTNYLELFPIRDFAVANPDDYFSILQVESPLYEGTPFLPTIRERPQNSYSFGLDLSYRNLTFSLIEMYRQNHSAIGNTAVIFSYGNPNSYTGDRIRRLTLSHVKEWNKLSLTSNLSYNRYRMNPNSFNAVNYDAFGGISYRYAASDDIFAEALLRYTSNRNWEWTVGISGQLSGILPPTSDLEVPFEQGNYKAFSTQPLPAHPLLGNFGFNPLLNDNIGAFIQVLKSGKKWTSILGLRLDRNSAYQNVNNSSQIPSGQLRAALQYRVKENLSFRFSFGTAVKAPSPSDAYASLGIPDSEFPQDSVSYELIPNTNLQPEFLSSVELGTRYQFHDKLSFELIFQSQLINSRINRILTSIDRNIYPRAVFDEQGQGFVARSFLNDDNAESTLSSITFILKGKNIISTWNLNFDFNLSLNTGDEQLTVEDGSTFKFNFYRAVPGVMGQFNIDFQPHKNWYFRFENVYMSSWFNRFTIPNSFVEAYDNETEGYYTLDALVRYNLSNHLSSYLRVINVFNADYGGIGATGFDVDLPYNPQYLRTFQFGLNFEF